MSEITTAADALRLLKKVNALMDDIEAYDDLVIEALEDVAPDNRKELVSKLRHAAFILGTFDSDD